MIPGGIILTRMIWRKRGRAYSRWIVDTIFNVLLLPWQLLFLIVGKIYGKVDMPSEIGRWTRIFYLLGSLSWAINSISVWQKGWWYLMPICYFLACFFLYCASGISWRDLWQAATVCHVRLCLGNGLFVSFTAPEVKIEVWRPDMIKDRFSYRDPAFNLTEAQIDAMNAYARGIKGNPVARRYDFFQLVGYTVWLAYWIIRPSRWGREIKPWLNLPGGRETCSSGVTAILRWAVYNITPFHLIGALIFPGYSISMVPPCLFAIDKDWPKFQLSAGGG